MRPTTKRWIWLGVKLVGSAIGLGYVLSIADVSEIASVASRVPASAIAAAIGATVVAMFVGAARWQLVLKAYGVDSPPRLLRLTRLYLIGAFYNAFLPGGVGGDVVRGVVTRESFGHSKSGVTGSLTVVLVERILGLAGLLAIVAVALALRPVPLVQGAVGWSVVGLFGAAAAVASVAVARRAAPHLPGRIGSLASTFPPLRRPAAIAPALLLSVGTQSLVALAGHVLLVVVSPEVTMLDSLVVVPLAAAAAFLPFTVGGAGAREAVFVVLCGEVLGVTAADAAATSLLLWACQLSVAAFGGVLQLVAPVRGKVPT